MADFRRTPFKEKRISTVSTTDIKVAITGTVVSQRDTGFLIGDGSGELFVNITTLDPKPVVQDNGVLRVFGRMTPYEQGVELHAELLQNLEGMDLEVLRRLNDTLYN